MSEIKKRAALDFGSDDDLPPPPPPVDPEAVRAVARQAGFRATPSAASERPSSQEVQPVQPRPTRERRARRKTGRTEQFATRLKQETLEAIYVYADKHEITLAETIEKAVAALNQLEIS